MALNARNAILLAKTEVTYGVDPVPTGAANAMLAANLKVSPMEGQEASRDFDRGYFSAPQKIPTGLYGVATFDIEMIGHAVKGTAPAWSAIAKACGLAEVITAGTSVVYNPVSSGHSSVTLYYHLDGVKQALTGCRGTGEIKVNAHGIPVLAVRLTGIYSDPADAANPGGVSFAGFQDPQVANYANTPSLTLNGVATVARSYTLNLGNQVVYRELINSRAVLITDAQPTIAAQVEATAMATLNPFVLAKNQTAFSTVLVHGTGAGKITTITAPNCRMSRPGSPSEQDNIVEWPLNMAAMPTAGNDAFTISLT